MKANVYLALGIASVVGLIVTFILFFSKMLSEDFFTADTSVFDLMITLFLYIGLTTVFMVLLIIFFVKYSNAKLRRTSYASTKRCNSCGADIEITELTCPRCFALQPPGGSSRDRGK